MVKLIMTDIDGTLIPDGTMDINPEYFEVIEKLVEKGIIFVVASGRHMSCVCPLHWHLVWLELERFLPLF